MKKSFRTTGKKILNNVIVSLFFVMIFALGIDTAFSVWQYGDPPEGAQGSWNTPPPSHETGLSTQTFFVDDPTEDEHIASKSYVDSQISGLESRIDTLKLMVTVEERGNTYIIPSGFSKSRADNFCRIKGWFEAFSIKINLDGESEAVCSTDLVNLIALQEYTDPGNYCSGSKCYADKKTADKFCQDQGWTVAVSFESENDTGTEYVSSWGGSAWSNTNNYRWYRNPKYSPTQPIITGVTCGQLTLLYKGTQTFPVLRECGGDMCYRNQETADKVCKDAGMMKALSFKKQGSGIHTVGDDCGNSSNQACFYDKNTADKVCLDRGYSEAKTYDRDTIQNSNINMSQWYKTGGYWSSQWNWRMLSGRFSNYYKLKSVECEIVDEYVTAWNGSAWERQNNQISYWNKSISPVLTPFTEVTCIDTADPRDIDTSLYIIRKR